MYGTKIIKEKMHDQDTCVIYIDMLSHQTSQETDTQTHSEQWKGNDVVNILEVWILTGS